jgi:hypothetical protein
VKNTIIAFGGTDIPAQQLSELKGIRAAVEKGGSTTPRPVTS